MTNANDLFWEFKDTLNNHLRSETSILNALASLEGVIDDTRRLMSRLEEMSLDQESAPDHFSIFINKCLSESERLNSLANEIEKISQSLENSISEI